MGALAGRRIVLGVTGGIAAFKAVEVASLLRKEGAELRVVMTRAAASFVTPLTFREVANAPVAETMWGAPQHHVAHISLASFAEMVLVAPATANFLAKAAAVADYRPAEMAEQKIKKSEGTLTLTLTRNPDILYELGQKKTHQVLVGFAAETQNVEAYARDKLRKKNLDFIVANNVAEQNAGFGTPTNHAQIFYADGRMEECPMMAKSALAGVILDRLEDVIRTR